MRAAEEPGGSEGERKRRPRVFGLHPCSREMPKVLGIALLTATVLNGFMIVAWVGFALRWVDVRAPLGGSVVGVFTVPLFIGTVEAVRGRRGGRWLLRFGSILFIFFMDLTSALDLWDLDDLPQYRQFLAARSRD